MSTAESDDPPAAGIDPAKLLDAAAQEIAAEAKAPGIGVRAVVLERGLLTAEDFHDMISAESVTRLGSPLRKEKQHS